LRQLLCLRFGSLIQTKSLIGVLVQALDDGVAGNKGIGVAVDLQLLRLRSSDIQIRVGRLFTPRGGCEHC
jgi:hypothetical protein